MKSKRSGKSKSSLKQETEMVELVINLNSKGQSMANKYKRNMVR